MSLAAVIIRELFGMFVDDGFLTLAILGVVGLAALAAASNALPPLASGGLLLAGCIAALMASVFKARAG